MHPSIDRAFNEIDAAIYSGDAFVNQDNLDVLKKWLDRWQRALPELQDLANYKPDETQDSE